MSDLLYDGNNFLIRNMGGAGFRTSDGDVLRTSTGIETGMLLGAINAFVALQNRFQPDGTVFCFDAGRSTYRLGLRKTYKANRNATPDPVEQYNLKPQFGYFFEFLDIMEVPYLRVPGVEADDLLAYIARTTAKHAVIVSADHDLLQLVSDHVSVLKPAAGFSPEKLFTPAEVQEKYHLTPRQLPEMWALMGDTGDGIEGIPGIGPKRATAMIHEHGGLDQALAYDKRCFGLERHVYTNLAMINLDGSVGAPHVPADLDTTFRRIYPSQLREFFLRFELNSLVRRFDTMSLWKEPRKDKVAVSESTEA